MHCQYPHQTFFSYGDREWERQLFTQHNIKLPRYRQSRDRYWFECELLSMKRQALVQFYHFTVKCASHQYFDALFGETQLINVYFHQQLKHLFRLNGEPDDVVCVYTRVDETTYNCNISTHFFPSQWEYFVYSDGVMYVKLWQFDRCLKHLETTHLIVSPPILPTEVVTLINLLEHFFNGDKYACGRFFHQNDGISLPSVSRIHEWLPQFYTKQVNASYIPYSLGRELIQWFNEPFPLIYPPPYSAKVKLMDFHKKLYTVNYTGTINYAKHKTDVMLSWIADVCDEELFGKAVTVWKIRDYAEAYWVLWSLIHYDEYYILPLPPDLVDVIMDYCLPLLKESV